MFDPLQPSIEESRVQFGYGARVTVRALLDQISEILPGRNVVFEGNTQETS